MHDVRIRRTIRILTLALLATSWAWGRAGAQMRITSGTTTFQSAVNEVTTDYFRPLDDQKHPAIIYLHGGGNSVNDPVMKRFAAELAHRGFVVIMPHYLEIHHSNWYSWQTTARDAVTYAQSLP
jgi:poly(3-hydroxybutyrate) depolymerase